MGPSGSGKTSFLRALAGLWTTGTGNITFYMKDAGQVQTSISADTNASKPINSLKKGEELESSENRRARGIFFLPQRPYMVLGTLHQQLLYPTWSEDIIFPSENSQKTGKV